MYDPRYVLRSFDTLSSDHKLAVLTSMLESLILANSLYLIENPNTPLLYHANLRYEAEVLGEDDWRDIPSVLDHRGGDCEDLCAYRVAELRQKLSELNAKPVISSALITSPKWGVFTLYHIRVQRQDGSIEDPSKLLGMV